MAVDEAGEAHAIWEGVDTALYAKNAIAWFVREFARTDYLVKRIQITLVTNRVWGWNEIDAVQLVGEKSGSLTPSVSR